MGRLRRAPERLVRAADARVRVGRLRELQSDAQPRVDDRTHLVTVFAHLSVAGAISLGNLEGVELPNVDTNRVEGPVVFRGDETVDEESHVRLVQRRLGGAAVAAQRRTRRRVEPPPTLDHRLDLALRLLLVFAQLRGAHELRPSQRHVVVRPLKRRRFALLVDGRRRDPQQPCPPALLRRPLPSLNQPFSIPKAASHLVQYVDRRTEESRELLE